MKKSVSLILVIITMFALAVPVSAKSKNYIEFGDRCRLSYGKYIDLETYPEYYNGKSIITYWIKKDKTFKKQLENGKTVKGKWSAKKTPGGQSIAIITFKFNKAYNKYGKYNKYSMYNKSSGVYEETHMMGYDCFGDDGTDIIKVPNKVSSLKLSKVKNGIKLKWSKALFWDKSADGIFYDAKTGYEIQYSTNKKFKNKRVCKVNSQYSASKIITGLKSYKKYYFRIRAFIVVNGKTMNTGFSKVKSIKTGKIVNYKAPNKKQLKKIVKNYESLVNYMYCLKLSKYPTDNLGYRIYNKGINSRAKVKKHLYKYVAKDLADTACKKENFEIKKHGKNYYLVIPGRGGYSFNANSAKVVKKDGNVFTIAVNVTSVGESFTEEFKVIYTNKTYKIYKAETKIYNVKYYY